MNILIERLSDPGHRETWEFQYNEGNGLKLDRYSIQHRQTKRHKWVTEAKWDHMDERRYNSKLERPTAIPADVLKEAITEIIRKIESTPVFIGWYNKASEVSR